MLVLLLSACTWISGEELAERLDGGKGAEACADVEDCATPGDDDCDGATDAEGALGCVTWRFDGDGDGFGTDATACWCAAQAASGYDAAVGGDCDDADAAVSPGAVERCDDTTTEGGRDENCDGLADDDVGAEAEGRVVYYPDADGDGYGDAASGGRPSCAVLEAPAWTLDASDCDDTSAGVAPGAQEGVADGIDQDCDGGEDCYVDADGDHHRSAESAHTVPSDDPDCDDLGETTSLVMDDCDDDDPAIPGVEAWDRRDNDCDGEVDDLDVVSAADGVLYGASASLGLGAGHMLSLGGDLDLDGLDDLVLLSEAGPAGVGWVVSGAAAVGASGAVEASASATLSGQASYPLAYVAGPMVDLVGDSAADLLVGGSSASYGRVWLLDGAGAVGAVSLASSYTARWEGDSADDRLRVAVTGDIDGDGVAEIVAGSAHDDHLGAFGEVAHSGSVAVFAADTWTGEHDPGDATDEVHGGASSDYLGQSVVVADVTGDGYADIVAGAPGVDGGAFDAGALYVLAGNSGLAWAVSGVAEAAMFQIAGDVASMALGDDPLPAPGDLTGSGRVSLAFTSSVTGEAWVYLDAVGRSGSVALAEADASWAGPAAGFATALACASDLDGDGVDDLVLGASGDATRAAAAGAVFVFPGGGAWTTGMSGADADGVFYGAAADDRLGAGLAGGGDLDGDGRGDLLLGAPGVDTEAADGGAVYVVRGR